jgi:hypothetical protein
MARQTTAHRLIPSDAHFVRVRFRPGAVVAKRKPKVGLLEHYRGSLITLC